MGKKFCITIWKTISCTFQTYTLFPIFKLIPFSLHRLPLSLSLSLIFTNDSSFTLPATHILSSSRFYCLPTPIYTRTKIPPRSLSKVFIIVVNNSRRKPAFHRLQRVYLAYKNM